ncbi:MAG: hypothetical protein H6849_00400 [Alphaproteobacteria bacterium]|nr:MAG: hypothetical protein H6849_00400 [Alphaproteobacteria bacterium]
MITKTKMISLLVLILVSSVFASEDKSYEPAAVAVSPHHLNEDLSPKKASVVQVLADIKENALQRYLELPLDDSHPFRNEVNMGRYRERLEILNRLISNEFFEKYVFPDAARLWGALFTMLGWDTPDNARLQQYYPLYQKMQLDAELLVRIQQQSDPQEERSEDRSMVAGGGGGSG